MSLFHFNHHNVQCRKGLFQLQPHLPSPSRLIPSRRIFRYQPLIPTPPCRHERRLNLFNHPRPPHLQPPNPRPVIPHQPLQHFPPPLQTPLQKRLPIPPHNIENHIANRHLARQKQIRLIPPPQPLLQIKKRQLLVLRIRNDLAIQHHLFLPQAFPQSCHDLWKRIRQPLQIPRVNLHPPPTTVSLRPDPIILVLQPHPVPHRVRILHTLPNRLSRLFRTRQHHLYRHKQPGLRLIQSVLLCHHRRPARISAQHHRLTHRFHRTLKRQCNRFIHQPFLQSHSQIPRDQSNQPTPIPRR